MRKRAISGRLFDKVCIVHKFVEQLDEFNTPIGEGWDDGKSYRCAVSKRNIRTQKSEPADAYEERVMLFTFPTADIQEGNLISVDGTNYRAGKPYIPRNHHMEVELTKEGDY